MFKAVFTGLLILDCMPTSASHSPTSIRSKDKKFGTYKLYLFNLAGMTFMLAGNNSFAPFNSVLL